MQTTAATPQREAATQDDLLRALREHFGHDAFRPGQRAVVERVMAGRSTAAILPTGSGKSLGFQLPALLLPGTTLVVSPLKALMKDQVDALRARGIAAARLDSGMSYAEYRDAIEAWEQGRLKLLYVAPERFTNDRFLSSLDRVHVSFLAIDEAHCLSEWGHDFRPDYLRLARVAAEYGIEQVVCLTATATRTVERDICTAFDIAPEDVVRQPTHRPNLHLGVTDVTGGDRLVALVDVLRAPPHGPGIVYVTRRRDAEDVATQLVQAGLDARAFHAGLDEGDKRETQTWFQGSADGIVVATIAFGMGVDKPDIRKVVHANLPKSLEGYLQEIGRAGRDGAPARCALLYDAADVHTLRNFHYGTSPGPGIFAKLVRRLFARPRSDVAVYALARELGMREESLRTVLALLEERRLLRAHTPFHAELQYRLLVPEDDARASLELPDQARLDRVLKASEHKIKWSTFELTGDLEGIGLDRATVGELFDRLAGEGVAEVRRTGHHTPYEVVQHPHDRGALASELHGHFLDAERRGLDRTTHLVELLSEAPCLWGALAAYLGDDPIDRCGHCAACDGGGPLGPLAAPEAPPVPTEARRWVGQALARAPRLRREPLVLAQFLCGVYAPGVRANGLHRLDGYRGLTGHAVEDVEQWVVDHLA